MEATRGRDDAEAPPLEEPKYEGARRLTPREAAGDEAGDEAGVLPTVFPDVPAGVPAARSPVDGLAPLEEDETPRYDGSRRGSRTSRDAAASTGSLASAPSAARPVAALPAASLTPRDAPLTTPRALWARLADGGDLRAELKGKVDKVKQAKLRFATMVAELEDAHGRDEDELGVRTMRRPTFDSRRSMGDWSSTSTLINRKSLPDAAPAPRPTTSNPYGRRSTEAPAYRPRPHTAGAGASYRNLSPPAYTVREAEAGALDSPADEALRLLMEGAIPELVPGEGLLDLEGVLLEMREGAERDAMPADVEAALAGFDAAAALEGMSIAQVPLADVAKRRAEVEEGRLAALRGEAEAYASRELDLAWRETNARQRLVGLRQAAKQESAEARIAEAGLGRTRERTLRQQFARAQASLFSAVGTQRAAIRERYGFLETTDGVAGRRYQANWDLIPRPVELRLHMVRAVKDKLPRGDYVFLLSMQDRLSGKSMRWSEDHSYSGGGFGHFPAATRAIKHRGRVHDVELKVDQSVFALCPSQRELRPGNVLVLELFRLADKRNPRAAVVAWTVLPMCTPHLSVIEGKFRLPMLRGALNPVFDRHAQLERRITKSLESWVGNLYLEVRHLPRQTLDASGVLRDEHHVELDFINKLLTLPGDAKNDAFRRVTGAEATKAKRKTRAALFSPFQAKASPRVLPVDGSVLPDNGDTKGDDGDDARDLEARGAAGPPRPPREWFGRRATIFDRAGTKARQRDIDAHLEKKIFSNDVTSPLLSPANRAETPRDLLQDDLHTGQMSEDSGDELYATPAEKSQLPGGEVDGTWPPDASGPSRKRGVGARFDPAGLGLHDLRPKATVADEALAAAEALEEKWWADVYGDPTEADRFSFAVAEPRGRRRPLTPTAIVATKLAFLWQELFAAVAPDLRSSSYDGGCCGLVKFFCRRLGSVLFTTSAEHWHAILVSLMAFWLRLYVHYVSQWLLLKAMQTNVYGFKAQVYALEFKYMPDGLGTLEEVAVVFIGPVGVLFTFVAFCTLAYAWRRMVAKVSDLPSHFLAAFGLATFLDPILIFIVDLATSNYACDTRPDCRVDYTKAACHCYEGDAFKLWRRMVDDSNGGVVGIFYAAIIYFITMVASTVAAYFYLVEVHMNGRVIDTYRRLHGDDEAFFVPHDYEISLEELDQILVKAKRYRGPLDQQRRVAVADYELRDPLAPELVETSTHVTIYELQLSGARVVYRHFLRGAGGAIVEIFGGMAQHAGVDFGAVHRQQQKDGAASILGALDRRGDGSHRALGFFTGLRGLNDGDAAGHGTAETKVEKAFDDKAFDDGRNPFDDGQTDKSLFADGGKTDD